MNKCTFNSLIIALVLLVPCVAFALPGAHGPASGNGEMACNSCHISPASMGNLDSNYATNVCLRCHSGTGVNTTKTFATEDYSNPFGTINTAILPAPVKPLQTSHKWFGSDVVPAAGAVKPVDTALNGLNKSANFVSGGLFCARCHNVHATSGLQSTNSPYLRYPNNTDQLCLNCHRPRDTKNHALGTHPVNVIYSSAYKANPTEYLQNPVTNAVNPTGQVKLVNGMVVCSSCHKTHNADSRTSTFDPYSTGHIFGKLSSSKGYLLRVDAKGKTANDLNICTNCHAGRKSHNKNGQNVQCNDCHSGHVEYDAVAAASGTAEEKKPNVNLVRRYLQYSTAGRVNKRIFYRYTGSTTKEFYNAAGKGVCQSCHNPPSTGVNNHNNGDGTFPNPGHSSCNACHIHKETAGSFSYGLGTGCNSSCHGLPPTSNTVGTGGKASGYTTYDESLTPHASHAAGGATYYRFACDQCHKGSTMPNGNFVEVFQNHTGILAGATAAYSSSTCSTVYCHSNGRGTYVSLAWGNNINSIMGLAPAARCVACHPAASYSPTHARHITAMGYGCITCHSSTVSDNTTLLASARLANGSHVNGVKDIQYSGISPAVGSSCATIYCHSDGNGAAPIITPDWTIAASGACGACHKTAVQGPLATGAHTTHFTLIADSTPSVNCVKCHAYTVETAATHVNGTINVNYDGTGCATNLCHGSIALPAWTGSYAGKDTCTKCHGTLTNTGVITPTSNNRYLVAPSDVAATDIGKVSANVKTGAHQTHLRYLNGFSNYSTVDYRCESCHGAPLPAAGAHADGTSSPAGKFRNIATKWGAMTGQTYTVTTCANTYCHNPAGTGGTLVSGNAGTNPAPNWNDPTYIDNGGKTDANCSKCHKVPGSSGFTKQSNHGSNVTVVGYNCSTCHGHNGDNTGAVGKRHMDGIFYANGACDSCHGYPPMSAVQLAARGGTFVNARLQDYSGGGGYHVKHLATTVAAIDGFTPCLACHPSGYHQQGGSTVARVNIQVNDLVDRKYRFDDGRTKRYNSATWSCSNISCHFQPTPAWNI